MKDSFEFEDAGRTFECSAEQMRKASPEKWWWFRVSTEDQNRYAPFRVESGDTQSSVQQRVVAYYDDLLVRRAALEGWIAQEEGRRKELARLRSRQAVLLAGAQEEGRALSAREGTA